MAPNVTKFLAAPGKIAHALDWRKQAGSVLSLHIGTHSIDLAVTTHPSMKNPIQSLPSIPIESETRGNQKVLKRHILEELSSIVEDWKVCGMVVSWPVQKEGWCGAPCGKVLHTLDQLVQDSSIVSSSRPVCLWDGHHFLNTEDEWGRVALYGVPSQKLEHRASKEQYREEGMVAADIAKDYIRHHWPEFVMNLERKQSEKAASTGKPKGLLLDPKWLNAYTKFAMPAKASLC